MKTLCLLLLIAAASQAWPKNVCSATVSASEKPHIQAHSSLTIALETSSITTSTWHDLVHQALAEVTPLRRSLVDGYLEFMALALSSRFIWIWAFLLLALLMRL